MLRGTLCGMVRRGTMGKREKSVVGVDGRGEGKMVDSTATWEGIVF